VWRTSNTYRLIIPAVNEELVVGWDPDISSNWCAYIADVTSPPDIRASNTNRSAQDGAVQGDSYLGGRSVVFDLRILESDPVQRGAQIRKLARIMHALRHDVLIRWTEDDGAEREVVARLVTHSGIQHEDQSPVKKVQLGFSCADPTIRSQRLWQRERDAATTFTVDNVGDWVSKPKVFMFGPATRFDLQWTNEGVMKTTQITGLTMTNGEYIELDSYLRTVRLNGGRNQYGRLTAGMDELPYLPANSTTTFTLLVTGGDSNSHVRVDWRHRWLI
jgi:hypothetical protein